MVYSELKSVSHLSFHCINQLSLLCSLPSLTKNKLLFNSINSVFFSSRLLFWLIWRPHNADFLHPIGWLKRPFYATWLRLSHTAAFVLQIHPRCAALRRGKESSRTSVKFKPANKRWGCSIAAAFVDIKTESWWKMMHAFKPLNPGNWQSKGWGWGVNTKKIRSLPWRLKSVLGWTKEPRSKRVECPSARRGSAAQNVVDRWTRTRTNDRD